MVQGSWSIDSANDNSGAPIYFKGASSARNFRIGNQIGWNDVFEITPSTANGNVTWQNTPAVAVHALLPRHVQPLTSNIRQEQEPLTAEPQKASTHTQQQTSRHRHRVQVHMITHQTTATNRYDVWAGRVG